jgi:hypothetical protein
VSNHGPVATTVPTWTDNVYLSLAEVAGKQVLVFGDGAPVRVSDQLSLAEATIS